MAHNLLDLHMVNFVYTVLASISVFCLHLKILPASQYSTCVSVLYCSTVVYQHINILATGMFMNIHTKECLFR